METTNKKTALIVEDQEIDLSVLNKILSSEYNVIEAHNGKQAFDVLKSDVKCPVDFVVTDLAMPVMDGFQLMKAIRDDKNLCDIPLIVATENSVYGQEEKVLNAGAWDFLSKPINPKVLMLRIENALIKSQMRTSQEIAYLFKFDPLTGIYNKNQFLINTRQLLDENPSLDFDLVHVDIRSFKLINSVFGVSFGDEVLKELARKISENFKSIPFCSYGRIQSDLFAFCAPSKEAKEYRKLIADLNKRLLDFPSPFHLDLSFGIYKVTDKSLDVSVMLDKANSAALEGRKAGTAYGVFSEKMEDSFEEEKKITSQMTSALNSGEFQVFYQPKYDLKSNKVAGAEALTRWFSPTMGIVSPGKFIPVFEKNGFISTLDQYVWEETCKFLAECIKKGETPLPISVNVSKLDVFSINIVDRLTSLVEKYHISPSLLCLEITESIFIEDIQFFNGVIKSLREKGFSIFMDDFGSGYSSLNVLKDMEVDVLKIDMKFFSYTTNKKKSNSIVEGIIQLAHSIGMPVIAEGVEEKNQADFLRLINCDYIQGFIFSKAINKEDYATLLAKPDQTSSLSFFDLSLIWDDDTRSVFDSSLQASCIIKNYSKRQYFEYVYANNAYKKMFGSFDPDRSQQDIGNTILPDYKQAVLNVFKKCHDLKNSNQCEFMMIMLDGKIGWVALNARLIYESQNYDVVLCSFNDISAVKSLKNELCVNNMQDRAIHLSSLIISSDQGILSSVSNMLVTRFDNIATAKNGDEGAENLKLMKENLSLLIVDISLGEKELEKITSLIGVSSDRSYKVLTLVTNQQKGADLIQKFNNIDDFIIYPFTKKMLFLRIRNLLSLDMPYDEFY